MTVFVHLADNPLPFFPDTLLIDHPVALFPSTFLAYTWKKRARQTNPASE
jgi:hypothetical protein